MIAHLSFLSVKAILHEYNKSKSISKFGFAPFGKH